MTDTNWIRTIKSPRPRTIAGWFRLARRGQVWWPGKTFTIDLKDEQEGHSPPAGSAATPVPHKGGNLRYPLAMVSAEWDPSDG